MFPEGARKTRRKTLQLHGLALLELDRCIELNRSVSLFFVITRILLLLAAIVLVTTNVDLIYVFLNVEQRNDAVADIATLFTNTISSILGLCILTSCIGIFGFSTLNRYLLASYGSLCIIEVMWIGYFMCTSYNAERVDSKQLYLFENYKYNSSAQTLVKIFQTNYKCCGTSIYRFEDFALLPVSCCNLSNEEWYCTPKQAHKKICNTRKYTLYESLNIIHFHAFAPYLLLGCTVIAIISSSLSFDLVNRVGNTLEDW